MQQRAILVGNSDGIGMATTRRLLVQGWNITGLSRSASAIKNPAYDHRVVDVSDGTYFELIDKLARSGPLDLCIYFVGIGEALDPLDMTNQARVFDVNLTAMVKTASAVVPAMVRSGHGHFIGLSSLGDELISAEAPSYFASKAGFSSYLSGLGMALRPRGVYVTNIRFGFVDTKMAKSPYKPFMMSVEKAVDHVEYCIRRKPARYTAPRIAIPFVKCVKIISKLAAVVTFSRHR